MIDIVWILVGFFAVVVVSGMLVFVAEFISDIYPELVRIAKDRLRKF